MTWHHLLSTIASVSPVTPESTASLDQSLRILDVDIEGGTVLEAAIGFLVIGTTLSAGCLIVAAPVLGLSVLCFFGLCATATVTIPDWVATAHQTRALGELPEIIGLGVLRMRVHPTPETAAKFAARHARGPIAADLREHVRRARGTPAAGWDAFATAWGEDLPTLVRATSLLTAASHADQTDRSQLLDDALTLILEGTRDRMAEYADELRGPTTGLYAFGVVLPLATIGALPTLRAAGIPIDVTALAIVYDGVLPLTVLAAGIWLIGQRPAAFPPPIIASDHPDLGQRYRRMTLATFLGGGATILVCRFWFPPWTPWLVVPAMTVGIALLAWARPVTAIRDRIRLIETGLPDALTIVGQRLQQGDPPEAAIETVGSTLDGPTGSIFDIAADVQHRLGVGVEAAFLGENGALAHIQSPRLTASATLLAVAGREGTPGGQVLVDLADHLTQLQTVQTESRRELAAIVGTLRSTACCFAPIIGGATVALAIRIDGATLSRTTTGMNPSGLAVVVGVYVFLLAIILAGFAAALEHGIDRPVIGEQIGYALVTAGLIYPTAVVVAGWLV